MMVAVSTVDHHAIEELAAECVTLAAREFGQELDWSPEGLGGLDEVCLRLRADGPLTEPLLDRWAKLAGAYTGEVAIRAYDGQWVTHPRRPGAYAISVLGITGYPFATARRVLSGEEGKSLASFARAIPVIARRTEN